MAFCSSCGAKIADNASFCSVCGAKVIPVEQEQVSVTNAQRVNMTGLQNQKSGFEERIESTNDRNLNHYLFLLYQKLLPPVRRIEQLSAAINKNGYELSQAKKFQFVYPNVGITVAAAFILLIVFVVGWSHNLDMYSESASLMAQYESEYAYAADHMGIFFPLRNEVATNNLWKLKVPIVFLIYGAIIAVIIAIIGTIISNILAKNSIPRLEKSLRMDIAERNSIVEKIKDYICYVPPSYRYSDAISYFVDSYNNTRANNLQEAVREYDAYIRDKNLQENIMTMRAEICSQLQDIQALQLATQAELASINSSIWAANIMF